MKDLPPPENPDEPRTCCRETQVILSEPERRWKRLVASKEPPLPPLSLPQFLEITEFLEALDEEVEESALAAGAEEREGGVEAAPTRSGFVVVVSVFRSEIVTGVG